MQSTRAKKHGTQQNEAQAIARWKIHFGRTRIDRLTTMTMKMPPVREGAQSRMAKVRAVNMSYRANGCPQKPFDCLLKSGIGFAAG